MRFDVILGEALRRAACPHVADCREFSAFDELQPLRHGFAVPPPLKRRRCVFGRTALHENRNTMQDGSVLF